MCILTLAQKDGRYVCIDHLMNCYSNLRPINERSQPVRDRARDLMISIHLRWLRQEGQQSEPGVGLCPAASFLDTQSPVC